jgi:hypothetical protein
VDLAAREPRRSAVPQRTAGHPRHVVESEAVGRPFDGDPSHELATVDDAEVLAVEGVRDDGGPMAPQTHAASDPRRSRLGESRWRRRLPLAREDEHHAISFRDPQSDTWG